MYRQKYYGNWKDSIQDFRSDCPINRDFTLVATGGCFDLFHLTHLGFLVKAARLGDKLLVLVNSDVSTNRLKGKTRPVFGHKERAIILASLECVDFVMTFNERDPCEALKLIKPDIWVKSGYRWEDMPEKDVVEAPEQGGICVQLAPVSGESTTQIIQRIRDSKTGEWSENGLTKG